MILAGVALGRYPHVCAFFEDKDEEHPCFLPFIREAIEAGEKAFHVVYPAAMTISRACGRAASTSSRRSARASPFFAPPAEFMVEVLSRQQKRRKR